MSDLPRFDPTGPIPIPGNGGAVRILWDYKAQQVVDGGNVSCSLFDTHYVYMYIPGDPLPWRIERFNGDFMYIAEREIPELVQLAAMVSS